MTNDELRRKIAERLGYKSYVPGTSDAWAIEPGDTLGVRTLLPNWPESLDACWRDLVPETDSIGVTIAHRYNEQVFAICGNTKPKIAYDPNPARAWCIAWLKLQDAIQADDEMPPAQWEK